MKTLGEVDILIINDGEARELAREVNLVKVAKKILSFGPKTLIIKRGEYGALMFNNKTTFSAPAYPLENVFDPTGAGDSFAGGFMGFLSYVLGEEKGGEKGEIDDATIRQAVIYGSVMASFNVEAFSLDRMRSLTQGKIQSRYREFKALTFFENI